MCVSRVFGGSAGAAAEREVGGWAAEKRREGAALREGGRAENVAAPRPVARFARRLSSPAAVTFPSPTPTPGPLQRQSGFVRAGGARRGHDSLICYYLRSPFVNSPG